MEFTISRKTLVQLLRTAGSAAAKLTTQPILREILLEVTPDAVYATGYNGQFGIIARQAVEADVVQVKKTGRATVDPVVVGVAQNFEGEEISLQLRNYDKARVLYITDGKAEFELPSSDDRLYPPVLSFHDELEGETISGQTLSQLLQKIAPSAADESTRIALSGIHFRVREGELILEASNSHMISQGFVSHESKRQGDQDVIVPKTSLLTLMKNLPSEENVEFAVDENLFWVKTNRLLFFTTLIDATFPDTSKVWERAMGNPTTVSADKQAFRGAVSRAMILAKEEANKPITLEVEKVLRIRTKVENSNAKEDVNVAQINGKAKTLSFNAGYLSQLTSVVDRDQLVLVFGDAAVYFEDNNSRHLILAVRV
ncbi:DNA polymerase III subunit beta [Sulfoacidibacillus thermotolerans]|uniref:Beta sliding clamp n=1 Tax=Sulfoacidibacillus thermotolerans TaxID=1765684 RepID=A0A2U3D0S0_SULT2|nr:DNA polymerase III subunit beta [Sulfoacidibacillus thermotolerans]PWI54868.1 DNA polymerase III subunit beta [Sulfoacidibacillus thermotolerans]